MVQRSSGSKPLTSPTSRASTPRHFESFTKTIRRWFCGHPGHLSFLAPEKSLEDEEEEPKQDLASSIRPIVASFIEHLAPGYTPSTKLEDSNLWSSALGKASSMGISCPEGSDNWKRLKVGFSYAHYCYPAHPLDIQAFIAVYTLFAQILDDHTPEGLQDIEKFVQRFCAREQQSTNVLRGWAQLMLEVHEYWSPIAANLIITSSLNFVTSTIIENRKLVGKEIQVKSGRAWAYYRRNLDGLGDAFAIFTFPAALYPDVENFVQAIPDMAMYIVHANDIISFYKEELEGEEDNYPHCRARYDGKNVMASLEDIVGETEASYRRIRELLLSGGSDGQAYADAWRAHEQGYIDFHVFSGRYKLRELGLEL